MKSQEQIFVELRSKVFHSEKYCMLDSCNEPAINSHVIQRSQFLEPIADEKSKLKFLDVKNIFPGKNPRFRDEYIRNILTFKGFCSTHDQMIFSPIENHPFDLTNHNHLVLFNYRAICFELRKKMEIVEFHKELIRSEHFPDIPNADFLQTLKGFELGIKDLQLFKKKAEADLIKKHNNFKFIIVDLPYAGIVCSSTFNFDSIVATSLEEKYRIHWGKDPLKALVFTVFPYADKLHMIIGYLESDHEIFEKFKDQEGPFDLSFVNKVILKWVETWACTTELYNSTIKDIQNSVLNYFGDTHSFEDTTMEIPKIL